MRTNDSSQGDTGVTGDECRMSLSSSPVPSGNELHLSPPPSISFTACNAARSADSSPSSGQPRSSHSSAYVFSRMEGNTPSSVAGNVDERLLTAPATPRAGRLSGAASLDCVKGSGAAREASPVVASPVGPASMTVATPSPPSLSSPVAYPGDHTPMLVPHTSPLCGESSSRTPLRSCPSFSVPPGRPSSFAGGSAVVPTITGTPSMTLPGSNPGRGGVWKAGTSLGQYVTVTNSKAATTGPAFQLPVSSSASPATPQPGCSTQPASIVSAGNSTLQHRFVASTPSRCPRSSTAESPVSGDLGVHTPRSPRDLTPREKDGHSSADQPRTGSRPVRLEQWAPGDPEPSVPPSSLSSSRDATSVSAVDHPGHEQQAQASAEHPLAAAREGAVQDAPSFRGCGVPTSSFGSSVRSTRASSDSASAADPPSSASSSGISPVLRGPNEFTSSTAAPCWVYTSQRPADQQGHRVAPMSSSSLPSDHSAPSVQYLSPPSELHFGAAGAFGSPNGSADAPPMQSRIVSQPPLQQRQLIPVPLTTHAVQVHGATALPLGRRAASRSPSTGPVPPSASAASLGAQRSSSHECDPPRPGRDVSRSAASFFPSVQRNHNPSGFREADHLSRITCTSLSTFSDSLGRAGPPDRANDVCGGHRASLPLPVEQQNPSSLVLAGASHPTHSPSHLPSRFVYTPPEARSQGPANGGGQPSYREAAPPAACAPRSLGPSLPRDIHSLDSVPKSLASHHGHVMFPYGHRMPPQPPAFPQGYSDAQTSGVVGEAHRFGRAFGKEPGAFYGEVGITTSAFHALRDDGAELPPPPGSCAVCWLGPTVDQRYVNSVIGAGSQLPKGLVNDIVRCSGCGLSVHRGCYGLPLSLSGSPSSETWFCSVCDYWTSRGYRCAADESSLSRGGRSEADGSTVPATDTRLTSSRSEHCSPAVCLAEGGLKSPRLRPSASQSRYPPVYCVLCNRSGGAFRIGPEHLWVHVACVLYCVEGPSFSLALRLQRPVGIKRFLALHRQKQFRCCLCDSFRGFTVRCGYPECYHRVHISCAFFSRLQPQLEWVFSRRSGRERLIKVVSCPLHYYPVARTEIVRYHLQLFDASELLGGTLDVHHYGRHHHHHHHRSRGKQAESVPPSALAYPSSVSSSTPFFYYPPGVAEPPCSGTDALGASRRRFSHPSLCSLRTHKAKDVRGYQRPETGLGFGASHDPWAVDRGSGAGGSIPPPSGGMGSVVAGGLTATSVRRRWGTPAVDMSPPTASLSPQQSVGLGSARASTALRPGASLASSRSQPAEDASAERRQGLRAEGAGAGTLRKMGKGEGTEDASKLSKASAAGQGAGLPHLQGKNVKIRKHEKPDRRHGEAWPGGCAGLPVGKLARDDASKLTAAGSFGSGAFSGAGQEKREGAQSVPSRKEALRKAGTATSSTGRLKLTSSARVSTDVPFSRLDQQTKRARRRRLDHRVRDDDDDEENEEDDDQDSLVSSTRISGSHGSSSLRHYEKQRTSRGALRDGEPSRFRDHRGRPRRTGRMSRELSDAEEKLGQAAHFGMGAHIIQRGIRLKWSRCDHLFKRISFLSSYISSVASHDSLPSLEEAFHGFALHCAASSEASLQDLALFLVARDSPVSVRELFQPLQEKRFTEKAKVQGAAIPENRPDTASDPRDNRAADAADLQAASGAPSPVESVMNAHVIGLYSTRYLFSTSSPVKPASPVPTAVASSESSGLVVARRSGLTAASPQAIAAASLRLDYGSPTPYEKVCKERRGSAAPEPPARAQDEAVSVLSRDRVVDTFSPAEDVGRRVIKLCSYGLWTQPVPAKEPAKERGSHGRLRCEGSNRAIARALLSLYAMLQSVSSKEGRCAADLCLDCSEFRRHWVSIVDVHPSIPVLCAVGRRLLQAPRATGSRVAGAEQAAALFPFLAPFSKQELEDSALKGRHQVAEAPLGNSAVMGVALPRNLWERIVLEGCTVEELVAVVRALDALVMVEQSRYTPLTQYHMHLLLGTMMHGGSLQSLVAKMMPDPLSGRQGCLPAAGEDMAVCFSKQSDKKPAVERQDHQWFRSAVCSGVSQPVDGILPRERLLVDQWKTVQDVQQQVVGVNGGGSAAPGSTSHGVAAHQGAAVAGAMHRTYTLVQSASKPAAPCPAQQLLQQMTSWMQQSGAPSGSPERSCSSRAGVSRDAQPHLGVEIKCSASPSFTVRICSVGKKGLSAEAQVHPPRGRSTGKPLFPVCGPYLPSLDSLTSQRNSLQKEHGQLFGATEAKPSSQEVKQEGEKRSYCILRNVVWDMNPPVDDVCDPDVVAELQGVEAPPRAAFLSKAHCSPSETTARFLRVSGGKGDYPLDSSSACPKPRKPASALPAGQSLSFVRKQTAMYLSLLQHYSRVVYASKAAYIKAILDEEALPPRLFDIPAALSSINALFLMASRWGRVSSHCIWGLSDQPDPEFVRPQTTSAGTPTLRCSSPEPGGPGSGPGLGSAGVADVHAQMVLADLPSYHKKLGGIFGQPVLPLAPILREFCGPDVARSLLRPFPSSSSLDTIPLPPFAVSGSRAKTCTVCFGGEWDSGNPIFTCSRCYTCVHKGCYAVPDNTSDEENETFFCKRCDTEKRRHGGGSAAASAAGAAAGFAVGLSSLASASASGVAPSAGGNSFSGSGSSGDAFFSGSIRCECCNTLGGALKRTSDGRWIHITCALFLLPETVPGDVHTLDNWDISGIQPWRKQLNCSVCAMTDWKQYRRERSAADGSGVFLSFGPHGADDPTNAYHLECYPLRLAESPPHLPIFRYVPSRRGACVVCSYPGCERAFHPFCAWMAGMYVEVNRDQSGFHRWTKMLHAASDAKVLTDEAPAGLGPSTALQAKPSHDKRSPSSSSSSSSLLDELYFPKLRVAIFCFDHCPKHDDGEESVESNAQGRRRLSSSARSAGYQRCLRHRRYINRDLYPHLCCGASATPGDTAAPAASSRRQDTAGTGTDTGQRGGNRNLTTTGQDRPVSDVTTGSKQVESLPASTTSAVLSFTKEQQEPKAAGRSSALSQPLVLKSPSAAPALPALDDEPPGGPSGRDSLAQQCGVPDALDANHKPHDEGNASKEAAVRNADGPPAQPTANGSSSSFGSGKPSPVVAATDDVDRGLRASSPSLTADLVPFPDKYCDHYCAVCFCPSNDKPAKGRPFGSSDSWNEVVLDLELTHCRRCGLAVHPTCYGLPLSQSRHSAAAHGDAQLLASESPSMDTAFFASTLSRPAVPAEGDTASPTEEDKGAHTPLALTLAYIDRLSHEPLYHDASITGSLQHSWATSPSTTPRVNETYFTCEACASCRLVDDVSCLLCSRRGGALKGVRVPRTPPSENAGHGSSDIGPPRHQHSGEQGVRSSETAESVALRRASKQRTSSSSRVSMLDIEPSRKDAWTESYVHVTCALYCPYLTVGSSDTLHPMKNLDRVFNSPFYNKRLCQLCSSSRGVVLPCSFPGCDTFHHPLCLQQCGCVVERRCCSEPEVAAAKVAELNPAEGRPFGALDDDDTYYGQRIITYCPAHSASRHHLASTPLLSVLNQARETLENLRVRIRELEWRSVSKMRETRWYMELLQSQKPLVSAREARESYALRPNYLGRELYSGPFYPRLPSKEDLNRSSSGSEPVALLSLSKSASSGDTMEELSSRLHGKSGCLVYPKLYPRDTSRTPLRYYPVPDDASITHSADVEALDAAAHQDHEQVPFLTHTSVDELITAGQTRSLTITELVDLSRMLLPEYQRRRRGRPSAKEKLVRVLAAGALEYYKAQHQTSSAAPSGGATDTATSVEDHVALSSGFWVEATAIAEQYGRSVQSILCGQATSANDWLHPALHPSPASQPDDQASQHKLLLPFDLALGRLSEVESAEFPAPQQQPAPTPRDVDSGKESSGSAEEPQSSGAIVTSVVCKAATTAVEAVDVKTAADAAGSPALSSAGRAAQDTGGANADSFGEKEEPPGRTSHNGSVEDSRQADRQTGAETLLTVAMPVAALATAVHDKEVAVPVQLSPASPARSKTPSSLILSGPRRSHRMRKRKTLGSDTEMDEPLSTTSRHQEPGCFTEAGKRKALSRTRGSDVLAQQVVNGHSALPVGEPETTADGCTDSQQQLLLEDEDDDDNIPLHLARPFLQHKAQPATHLPDRRSVLASSAKSTAEGVIRATVAPSAGAHQLAEMLEEKQETSVSGRRPKRQCTASRQRDSVAVTQEQRDDADDARSVAVDQQVLHLDLDASLAVAVKELPETKLEREDFGGATTDQRDSGKSQAEHPSACCDPGDQDLPSTKSVVEMEVGLANTAAARSTLLNAARDDDGTGDRGGGVYVANSTIGTRRRPLSGEHRVRSPPVHVDSQSLSRRSVSSRRDATSTKKDQQGKISSQSEKSRVPEMSPDVDLLTSADDTTTVVSGEPVEVRVDGPPEQGSPEPTAVPPTGQKCPVSSVSSSATPRTVSQRFLSKMTERRLSRAERYSKRQDSLAQYEMELSKKSDALLLKSKGTEDGPPNGVVEPNTFEREPLESKASDAEHHFGDLKKLTEETVDEEKTGRIANRLRRSSRAAASTASSKAKCTKGKQRLSNDKALVSSQPSTKSSVDQESTETSVQQSSVETRPPPAAASDGVSADAGSTSATGAVLKSSSGIVFYDVLASLLTFDIPLVESSWEMYILNIAKAARHCSSGCCVSSLEASCSTPLLDGGAPSEDADVNQPPSATRDVVVGSSRFAFRLTNTEMIAFATGLFTYAPSSLLQWAPPAGTPARPLKQLDSEVSYHVIRALNHLRFAKNAADIPLLSFAWSVPENRALFSHTYTRALQYGFGSLEDVHRELIQPLHVPTVQQVAQLRRAVRPGSNTEHGEAPFWSHFASLLTPSGVKASRFGKTGQQSSSGDTADTNGGAEVDARKDATESSCTTESVVAAVTQSALDAAMQSLRVIIARVLDGCVCDEPLPPIAEWTFQNPLWNGALSMSVFTIGQRCRVFDLGTVSWREALVVAYDGAPAWTNCEPHHSAESRPWQTTFSHKSKRRYLFPPPAALEDREGPTRATVADTPRPPTTQSKRAASSRARRSVSSRSTMQTEANHGSESSDIKRSSLGDWKNGYLLLYINLDTPLPQDVEPLLEWTSLVTAELVEFETENRCRLEDLLRLDSTYRLRSMILASTAADGRDVGVCSECRSALCADVSQSSSSSCLSEGTTQVDDFLLCRHVIRTTPVEGWQAELSIPQPFFCRTPPPPSSVWTTTPSETAGDDLSLSEAQNKRLTSAPVSDSRCDVTDQSNATALRYRSSKHQLIPCCNRVCRHCVTSAERNRSNRHKRAVEPLHKLQKENMTDDELWATCVYNPQWMCPKCYSISRQPTDPVPQLRAPLPATLATASFDAEACLKSEDPLDGTSDTDETDETGTPAPPGTSSLAAAADDYEDPSRESTGKQNKQRVPTRRSGGVRLSQVHCPPSNHRAKQQRSKQKSLSSWRPSATETNAKKRKLHDVNPVPTSDAASTGQRDGPVSRHLLKKLRKTK